MSRSTPGAVALEQIALLGAVEPLSVRCRSQRFEDPLRDQVAALPDVAEEASGRIVGVAKQGPRRFEMVDRDLYATDRVGERVNERPAQEMGFVRAGDRARRARCRPAARDYSIQQRPESFRLGGATHATDLASVLQSVSGLRAEQFVVRVLERATGREQLDRPTRKNGMRFASPLVKSSSERRWVSSSCVQWKTIEMRARMRRVVPSASSRAESVVERLADDGRDGRAFAGGDAEHAGELGLVHRTRRSAVGSSPSGSRTVAMSPSPDASPPITRVSAQVGSA